MGPAELSEIQIDVAVGGLRDDDELVRCFKILGFEGPGRREFTLLVGFEKITRAEYSIECPKALHKMKVVIKDGRRAPPCEFP